MGHGRLSPPEVEGIHWRCVSGLLISKKEAVGSIDPLQEAGCKKADLQGLARD